MEKAPASNTLPQQLDEQAMYYDIRIRNQKVLKNTNTGGVFGGGNPFDF